MRRLLDSHTILFRGRDLSEVSDFVDFVTRHNLEFAP